MAHNVTYSLDGNLDNKTREVFRKAVELWKNSTCINFEEDEEEVAEDLLLVYKEHGCWAEVGRQVGLQLISLGEGCDTVPVKGRSARGNDVYTTGY
ncbi:astacin [Ostertagia ostertagi]